VGEVTLTLKLEPCAAVGKPSGDVAYMRMPLALSAMDAMNRFVEKAYGKDCVCTEDPKGWLKVSTPNAEPEPRRACEP
jgi:hypothetical protein